MNDEEKKEEEKDEAGEKQKAEEAKTEEKPAEEKKPFDSTQSKEEEKEAPKKEKKEESKKESFDKAQDKKEPKPEPTGKFKQLIKDIESLSVIELSELVKALEDRFGVSAAAPVAVAQAPAGADGGAGEAETKTSFNVELSTSGEKKIDVIKAVREVNQDLGLKEAKDLVDGAPKMLKENVKKEEAEEIKKKIEAAGAKVTLK